MELGSINSYTDLPLLKRVGHPVTVYCPKQEWEPFGQCDGPGVTTATA
jgi:hypothetical protein